MTARILDSKRIADALPGRPQRRRSTRAWPAGLPRRARGGAGWRRPRQPSYVRVTNGAPRRRSASRRSTTTCRPGIGEGGIAGADRSPERRSGGARHLGATAAAGHPDASRLIERIDPRKDVDGFHPPTSGTWPCASSGCGRARRAGSPPCWRGPPGARPERHHRRGIQPCPGGRWRWVADRQLHGDQLPQSSPRRGAPAPRRRSRHPGRRGRAPRPHPRRMGPARRRGDRRRHQPPGRRTADRRRSSMPRRLASWITPVPGGVGPMTVATLMQNTLEAAELADGAAARA